MPIIKRSLDQTLPTSTLAAPEEREGRVQGKLHLILQITISAWQKCEQLWQVGGKLILQISLDQVMNGEKFGCCGVGFESLSPEAFPSGVMLRVFDDGQLSDEIVVGEAYPCVLCASVLHNLTYTSSGTQRRGVTCPSPEAITQGIIVDPHWQFSLLSSRQMNELFSSLVT